MKLSNSAKSALVLVVLVVAIVIGLAAIGANLGPIEFIVLLGILVVGLALIGAGARKAPSKN